MEPSSRGTSSTAGGANGRRPTPRIRASGRAGDPAVIRLVVGQAGALALVGVMICVGAALALTRILTGVLYDVSVRDPLTFVAG